MAITYNSNYIETMPFSDYCWEISVQEAAPQIVNAPGDSSMVFQAYMEYASDSNVYVGLNVVPTLPTPGSNSNQPYVEFKPKKRYIRGGDVLCFATPDTVAYCGVSFRQLQG